MKRSNLDAPYFPATEMANRFPTGDEGRKTNLLPSSVVRLPSKSCAYFSRAVLVSDKTTQHVPPDHHAQDLRCALADRQQALVAIDPLDRKLLAIAIPTKHLNRVAAGLFGHFRRKQLGHGSMLRKRPPLILQPGRLVDHQPSSLDAGDHIGDHIRDRLIRADRLAKGGALFRIRRCRLAGRLRQADRHRAYPDPPAVEHLQELREATTALAKQILLRNAHIFERDRGADRAAQAHLRLVFAE